MPARREAALITTDPTPKKRLGAYYTPPRLAELLVRWAVRSPTDRVLDPACGGSVFLEAAGARLRALGGEPGPGQVSGVELDEAAARAATSLVPYAQVTAGNFFDQEPLESTYDAVVGNPPYVRYHYFDVDRQRALRNAAQAGVVLNGLTSSWAPFLVHASRFLGMRGRLAFVLPAELLSTDYAAPVRAWLLRRFRHVQVLTFEDRVFPGAMVDAIFLLAEGEGPGSLHLSRLSGVPDLPELTLNDTPAVDGQKWTTALVEPSAAAALQEAAERMQPLGRIASVDIGIVTGANDFFLLSAGQVRELGLHRRQLHRLIARGSQVPRHVVTLKDWQQVARRGEPAWLFAPRSDDGAAAEYIRAGERNGVHKSYKCSVRKPWWRLKVPDPPDLILSYMANDAPRLVGNVARVVTTNLLHNVRLLSGAPAPDALALAWPNSATLLSVELGGRAYGGGVLKLETREAERVPVPRLTDEVTAELRRRAAVLDLLLSAGQIEAAADLVDPVVLGEIDATSRAALRSAWRDLRARRKRRATPARRSPDDSC